MVRFGEISVWKDINHLKKTDFKTSGFFELVKVTSNLCHIGKTNRFCFLRGKYAVESEKKRLASI